VLFFRNPGAIVALGKEEAKETMTMKSHPIANFGFALVLAVCALAPVQPLRASLAGKVIESLAKLAGRYGDDAAKLAAREALEKATAKYGDEVIELAERGGFGLAEAGAKYGDDVWRLAKLAPDAPRALAARAETLVPLARRYGDDALRAELKAPGCGEILATTLKPGSMRLVAKKASQQEVKRFAALSKHCSPEEVELAVKAWRKSGPKVLEILTPKRIAAAGGVAALLYGASKVPEMIPEKLPNPFLPDLSEPIRRTLQGLGAIAAGACLYFFRKPLFWLLRATFRCAGLLWRGLAAAVRRVTRRRAASTDFQ
jgi:hypothetical protein